MMEKKLRQVANIQLTVFLYIKFAEALFAVVVLFMKRKP